MATLSRAIAWTGRGLMRWSVIATACVLAALFERDSIRHHLVRHLGFTARPTGHGASQHGDAHQQVGEGLEQNFDALRRREPLESFAHRSGNVNVDGVSRRKSVFQRGVHWGHALDGANHVFCRFNRCSREPVAGGNEMGKRPAFGVLCGIDILSWLQVVPNVVGVVIDHG